MRPAVRSSEYHRRDAVLVALRPLRVLYVYMGRFHHFRLLFTASWFYRSLLFSAGCVVRRYWKVGRATLVFLLVLVVVFSPLADLLLPVPAIQEAQAVHWYAAGTGAYTYRKQLTIGQDLIPDTLSAAELAAFPVLVSYTDLDLRTTGNGGKVQQSPDGFDIIFTDTANPPVKLNHQIESYDPVTGRIVMWVRIPTLSATANTNFYIYYGNSSISTSEENVSGVWDSSFRGVWHMKENPSTSQMRDSTIYANHGTTFGGMLAGAQTTSQVNGGLNFDGIDDRVDTGVSTSMDMLPAMTISAWIYPRSDGENSSGMIAEKTGGAGNGWRFMFPGTRRLRFNVDLTTGTGGTSETRRASANNTLVFSTWQQVAVTWGGNAIDATDIRLYRNGAEVTYGVSASGTGTRDNDAPNNMNIGNIVAASTFDGIIDEVRVSNTVRTAAWLLTEFNNMNNQGSGGTAFIEAMGSEETRVDVGTSGSQPATATQGQTGVVLGTFTLTLASPALTTVSLHSVRFSETGTLNADTYLLNARLYRDEEATCSFTGATPIGAILPSFTSQSVNFDSLALTLNGGTQMCLFLVADIGAAAPPTDNIEIEITSPLDITFSGGSLFGATAASWPVQAPGTTNIISAAVSTFDQSGYRWFANANSLTPGAFLAGLNSAFTLTTNGQQFRLRLLIHVGGATLAASGQAFKLQYVGRGTGTCAAPTGGTPATYTDVSNSTSIAYYNNTVPADDSDITLATHADDPTHGTDIRRHQTYNDSDSDLPGTVDTFTNSIAAVGVGEDGLWDFALFDNSAGSSQTFCFRAVKSDGNPLDMYAVYPQITVASAFALFGTYTSNSINILSLRAWNVLQWEEALSGPCPTCDIRLQIQSAPDLAGAPNWAAGSQWCGPSGTCGASCGAASDWYTVPSGTRVHILHNGHPWIRYCARFDGDGTQSPILNKVKINYQ